MNKLLNNNNKYKTCLLYTTYSKSQKEARFKRLKVIGANDFVGCI